jgi:aarF domain-containing kinase
VRKYPVKNMFRLAASCATKRGFLLAGAGAGAATASAFAVKKTKLLDGGIQLEDGNQSVGMGWTAAVRNATGLTTANCEPPPASASIDDKLANEETTSTATDIGGGNSSSFLPENSTELIVPTLQATQRAARLVYTVLAMAAEYKIRPKLPSLPFEADAAPPETIELRQDIDHWHSQVEILSTTLQDAQEEYTSPVPDQTQESLVEGFKSRIIQQRKEAVHEAARDLAHAEQTLTSLQKKQGPNSPHARAAHRLLDLCSANGGVYIKVGQHLANLDYILPPEYIEALSSLFHEAPVSSWESVERVLLNELGALPEEIFDNVSHDPIASASLAQVHTAYDKTTGKKLAIKVQHEGLEETSKGDLFALVVAVRLAERLFPDSFGSKWNWLVEEIAPNLPRELDFHNEGENAERAERNLRHCGITEDQCVVPKIIWSHTTKRVLCMEFEEGFKSTDLEQIGKAGLRYRDVAKLVSSVFNSQVFLSGFVHCDPHPANVLLRAHPSNPSKPQVVLVDHGLYKEISEEFRITYAQLWKGLLLADIPLIKSTCAALGVTQMYTLLAAMLTSRPFDEIIERSQQGGALASGQKKKSNTGGKKQGKSKSKTETQAQPRQIVRQNADGTETVTMVQTHRRTVNRQDLPSECQEQQEGVDASPNDAIDGDKVMIRGYAQQYLPEIIAMLDTVPRQMLLLFKMNDCLRHIDYALRTPPTNSLVVAGRYAAKALLDHDLAATGLEQHGKKKKLKVKRQVQSVMDYAKVLFRIQAYEFYLWWNKFLISTKQAWWRQQPLVRNAV